MTLRLSLMVPVSWSFKVDDLKPFNLQRLVALFNGSSGRDPVWSEKTPKRRGLGYWLSRLFFGQGLELGQFQLRLQKVSLITQIPRKRWFDFRKFKIPLIKKPYPKLLRGPSIKDLLCNVQPMQGPTACSFAYAGGKKRARKSGKNPF